MGPRGGSWAAAQQASRGNVRAGSGFARTQSVTMRDVAVKGLKTLVWTGALVLLVSKAVDLLKDGTVNE